MFASSPIQRNLTSPMALLLPSPDVSQLAVAYSRSDSLARNGVIVRSGNGYGRVRFRVSCSCVKDLEVSMGTTSSSSSATSSSKQSKDEEEKRNYYLNTGYAIRTLREDFPALFYKEPDFNIYRDDIVFKDPVNTFIGIDNYKSIFWALRFHGRLFFRALWIDVVSVRQSVEDTIMVRWIVHGIPRVPWDTRGRFDGTSEYKLDKNGKIYEHKVHNIALNGPPKFHVISVQELIQVIGCSSTPKPTYFEILLSSIRDAIPSLTLAGIRHHLGAVLAGGPWLKKESSEKSSS